MIYESPLSRIYYLDVTSASGDEKPGDDGGINLPTIPG